MKNLVKLFGIIIFLVVIGFSMIACGDDGQGDLLNGVWDRGDIVVTFSGSAGVFTEIKSNSAWVTFLNNGTVSIGDRKFRNITYDSNLKWTGQELAFENNTTTWVNVTITISGQTLRAESPGTTNPVTTYTRQ